MAVEAACATLCSCHENRSSILGGGTGGTMVANRLRRRFDADEAEIHVVDRDDRHVYQPGLLFVPFGLARRRTRSCGRAAASCATASIFHEAEVDVGLRSTRDEVLLDDGTRAAVRRPRRRERRAAAARGDRGHDRPGLERARLHLLRRRRARRRCATRSSGSTAAGWS